MTSIGIMSMQRIRNYGSLLQAYGLKRLIESVATKSDVSFVDYRPGPTLIDGNAPSTPRSSLERTYLKVREYNAVEARLMDKIRFFNHKRTYATRYLPSIGITAERNFDQNLDILVIGSDEVFNCVQSNSNVGYSRDLFGHGTAAKKLISYAGSFGNTTIERIEALGLRADLEDDFGHFSSISVRDRNSARIVKSLTKQDPLVHVDPVLAHDFMHLESRIPASRQYDGKYIVVYGYAGRLNRSENASLTTYSRKIGAKILCFGGVQGCCDRFVDCNPFELLAYFRDAESIVTDTFHGTIFSIINGKPFGTIIRPTTGPTYGNEEKLGFLLETFGLSSNRVTDLTHIADVLQILPDYHIVGERLASERIRTIEYLKRAIR